MSHKSATCFGRTSGKPLTAYGSEAEAREGAAHARNRSGARLLPYRCDRCGKWHLAPAHRHTPSSACPRCRSANGRPKESYRTEAEARRRADILSREQGLHLKVYPCAHGNGWHLAKD